jgi:RimJ/RimL family protein N-acetyltransferase
VSDADVRLRRAEPEDVDFIIEVLTSGEVEPFLSVIRARDREGLLAEIERSRAEPQHYGRFVIETRDGDEWRRAGIMDFEVANRRSRIANLGGLAVHPGFRGRRIADSAARLLQRYLMDELGYHRLQLEIYGFNTRAIEHAERAGFVREGVRRKAYWRHDAWVDGILFGLVEDDR